METELSLLGNKNLEDGSTSHHTVNIYQVDKEWLASVEEKTKKSPRLLNKHAGERSCCIFKVPESLAAINEGAYQPQIVSIGPYHHGKEHLKMIEEHKWRFLGAVLARTQQHGVGLDRFFEAIASEEEMIRKSYSETIEYSRHHLIEMMVLDGCFIVELFRIVARELPRDPGDPIFNISWMIYFIMRDLLSLENQIPFFVLQTLFQLSSLSAEEDASSLTRLALEFFDRYGLQRRTSVLKGYSNLSGLHLLDLFRLSIVPSNENFQWVNSSLPKLIQPAKKLRVAGIQFSPRKTSNIWDIKFRNGVLEIPILCVDDFSTFLFQNCVAFEQCYKHCSKHVTSYLIFMSDLIKTPSDAELLSDRKVIENNFGTDEQVTKYFSDISKEVGFDVKMSYLAEIYRDVDKYCRSRRHVWWAEFKYTYFHSPLLFMSAVGALVLLILTMAQCYFAAYEYYKPPKNS